MQKEIKIIYIGNKEYKIYGKAIANLFNKGEKEIFIITRGKYIKNAIDICLFYERVSEGKVRIRKVILDSEKFIGDDKKEKYTSKIKINLIRR